MYRKLWGGALIPADRETKVQLIVARDNSDEEAEARRPTARAACLENAEGYPLVGRALLDHDGAMIGSACIAQFVISEKLDAPLLIDPYVPGRVWLNIRTVPHRTAPDHPCPPCAKGERAASREAQ